ncbi:MAG TPA: FAD-linked oxidase C-terminal domain-containing protein [Gaiellaceae bacterium]|jgi:D-lactate dehydrogenase (cytochrome)
MTDLRAALLDVLLDEQRVVDGESVLDQHAHDLTHHAPHRPDVVVFPETAAEAAAVLAFASAEGVPVVPFGAGTSLEGHVIPVTGGISLSLARMDRLVALRPDELNATVQPGLTRLALNAAAGAHGLFFPVDPGADASLGGMAATNASGTTTVRYGGMRRNVLALEVALGDGRVVRTGTRAAKSSAGYDLTSLFVGSEGTLGVITELTLRLYGIPDRVLAARATFASLDDACEAAAALVAAGAPVARVELLDALTLRAVNAYNATAFAETPTLFLEIEGDDADVRELCGGALSYESDADPTGRTRLWQARHNVLFALLASSPGKVHKATDVCVPVPMLADGVRQARAAIEARRLDASIVAHAGDGNYHVLFMLDPNDPAERERADELNAEIVEWALAHGGTCTGEHGIGLGKLEYLEQEHGDLIPLMRGIKALLDPAGILNPGKVVAS